MYKLLRDSQTKQIFGAIKDSGDGTCTSFIFHPDNTDYQAYLKWLAEGNQPLPAENS